MIGTHVKLKFDVRSESPWGWSEDYYLLSPPDGTFDTVLDQASVLAQKRDRMTANDVHLISVTVSDLAVKRKYKTIRYTPSDTMFYEEDEGNALPDAALLMIKENTDGTATGRTFLRGFPTIEYDHMGDYQPGAVFGAAAAAFKNELKNRPWGFLGESSPVDLRQKEVINVVQQTNGRPLVTVDGVIAGLTAGKKYKCSISGVQGCPNVNGQHVCKYDGANGFQLTRRTPIFDYVSGGELTVYIQGVVNIYNVVFDRWVGRKSGRPFNLLRGRSKVRVAG